MLLGGFGGGGKVENGHFFLAPIMRMRRHGDSLISLGRELGGGEVSGGFS